LTFNITFTPAAADLTGTVLLMEIGGTWNGTGLYLVEGVPVFVTKRASSNDQWPGPFDDTRLNDSGSATNNAAINHSYGRLTAEREYTIAAVYNPLGGYPKIGGLGGYPSASELGGLLRVAVDGGDNVDGATVLGSNKGDNWSGDDTLGIGMQNGEGSRGGLAKNSSAGVWSAASARSLTGEIADALYWNQTGFILPQENVDLASKNSLDFNWLCECTRWPVINDPSFAHGTCQPCAETLSNGWLHMSWDSPFGTWPPTVDTMFFKVPTSVSIDYFRMDSRGAFAPPKPILEMGSVTNITWRMTGAGAFQLQGTTNLMSPAWTNVGDILEGDNTSCPVCVPRVPGRPLFYRVIETRR